MYDYYHNLYWVARNPFIDKEEKLKIGNAPLFRDHPELLRQYICVQPEFHETLRQMREAVISGVHPYTLYSGPAYKHVPLPATFGATA